MANAAWEPYENDLGAPAEIVVAETMPALDDLLTMQQGSTPEERLSRAILETKTIADAYKRLGAELHPTLGWRATRMAETLSAAMRRFFGGLE